MWVSDDNRALVGIANFSFVHIYSRLWVHDVMVDLLSLEEKKNALRHHRTLYDDIILRDMSNASSFFFFRLAQNRKLFQVSRRKFFQGTRYAEQVRERQQRSEIKKTNESS